MAVPTLLIGLGTGLLSFVVFLFVSSVVNKRRYDAEARRRGCQPTVLRAYKLPLGVDQIQVALAADREMRFPTFVTKRFEDMGVTTFRYRILGAETFQTCDPKNIQALLATQFHDFALGRRRRGNFMPLLGNGIFTLDGKGWEHSRAMMRPQFARDQVSDLDLEERHVQNLMRALPAPEAGWVGVELQALFFRLTLDSATEFLFGESVDSQLYELPGHTTATAASRSAKAFARAFDVGQKWLATRSRFQGFYFLVRDRRFAAACKESQDFVDYFVRRALSKELREKEPEKAGEKDKYVFLEALAAQTRDPIELRSQMLNILLAGRDTTASLLGWLFYLLARHPAVYAKLRAVVLDTFGSYDEPRDLTFAKLKSCQFLQHCNNETLRLYPVVPVNAREAVRDTTLPRGGGPDGQAPVFVRAGQTVEYTVHAMHHRKDLWGPDAEEFKPERWEGRKVGWEYLPFNGGPRICIGQQFALTEASYVTVRLLQRFDRLENTDPEPTPKLNLTLTSCSGTGVQVRMHEAR
ncbi:MAG: hypothetical protein M1832_003476 [Thelocarpon impressellum]|nr:MAG: hypothetical protein M1832_003476 [Thelocarpon impressellum]